MRHYLPIILTCMVFVAFLGSISMADLMSDLIAYYSFDGNAEDSVAGRNGTEQNGAGYGDHAGFGQALMLDGTDDYVEVPHDPAFDTIAEAFTFAAWINPTAVDDRRPIISREFNPDANRGFEFAIKDGSVLAFQLVNEGGVNKTAINSTFTPDTNVWTHVAATYDSASGSEFFAHGTSVGTDSSFTGTVNTAVTPINIGAYIWDPNGYWRTFAGMIDELGIWARVLAPDEIAALAAGTIPTAAAVGPGGKLAVAWGELKSN
jgi:hypothetical protein